MLFFDKRDNSQFGKMMLERGGREEMEEERREEM